MDSDSTLLDIKLSNGEELTINTRYAYVYFEYFPKSIIVKPSNIEEATEEMSNKIGFNRKQLVPRMFRTFELYA